MTDCILCKNEIITRSERRVYQDESITIIHNLRPYYPDKIREGKQLQFLIMPNDHCQYESLSFEVHRSIQFGKKYLIEEFGGNAYISGSNTGPMSGASVPGHYHVHFTIVFDECNICKQITSGETLIKEYGTVVVLKERNSVTGKTGFIITTKRHGMNPLYYRDLEVNDLVLAETELRSFLKEAGISDINTVESCGSQAYFDTPVVTNELVTASEHPCTRLVCRPSVLGFGNMSDLRFTVNHHVDPEVIVRDGYYKKQKMDLETIAPH